MGDSVLNITKPLSKTEKEEDEPPDSLISERQIFPPELQKESSFFVEKSQAITIKSNFSQKGIRLEVGGLPFEIIYPEKYWSKFPNFFKKILSENLTFASTFHLPYLLNINSLNYQIPRPITESLFLKGFVLSLPSTALMKGEKTSNLLKKFFAIKFHFNGQSNGNVSSPNFFERQITKTAVLPFTFGKDSLLTYSLCKEIGVKPIPVFVREPQSKQENYHKEKLAEEFLKEFKEKIIFIDNETGKLREDGGWYGWELQLTQYAFLLLPIVFANKSRYLFFSNEQSCNEEFLDKEGFLCNPVFEQSAEWLKMINKTIKEMGVQMENLKIGSLIEPLHELAIVKILHSRYPEMGKYQSSCFEEKPEAKFNRWCGNCSKCARIYIFFLAHNINPVKIGIKTDMLELKYKTKFSLFENGNNKDSGYDKSRLGRDEQLLAFLMAYRNGYKGQLMDLFKSLYLKEAKKREKELREKYFGIHSTKTIPEELKDKVLKIYRQELKNLK